MTDNQTLPPPQGPEYARCFGCGHIEPEHQPGTGPCLVCACAAYRPVPVVSVSSPPPDQTALEERVARRLAGAWISEEDWQRYPASFRAEYLAYARDVLAFVPLPPPADRSAVLREEASLIRAHCPDHLDSNSAEGSWINCHCDVADDMERRAAEAQQPDTEARP